MEDFGSSFNKACKRLCNDLNQEFLENNIKKKLQGNRFEYNFTIKTENFKIVFTLTSDTDEKRAFTNIEIYHNNNIQSFHISSPPNLEMNKLLQGIERWASWAVCQYYCKRYPANLKSMFDGTSIRVYGYFPFTHPAYLELSIFLSGLKGNIKKLAIIRFRHVYDFNHYSIQESFVSVYSYAFSPITHRELTTDDPSSPVWIFFIAAGGSDRFGRPVDEIEKLIKEIPKEIDIIREDYYIELDQLIDYLRANAQHIGSRRFDNVADVLIPPHPYTFTPEYHLAYSDFSLLYDEKKYARAMRDLRVLVEEACKLSCKNVGVQVEKNLDDSGKKPRIPGIENYIDLLIAHKKLDKSLGKMSAAFTVIANQSSHRNYPTEEELNNPMIKMRTMLAFQIGTYLIKEMSEIRDNWTNQPRTRQKEG